MNTAPLPPVAAAPAPAQQQNFDVDLNILCEKLRKEAVLTPSSIINALCEDMPTWWICLKAIYVEEVREVARMLNRSHLLRFTADC
jgi:hypothetical protein